MKKLMKQASEMQRKMEDAQEKLKDIIVESSVGGGMVKVKMNCRMDVLDIEIGDEIIKAEEKDVLKDLLISGVNEAKRKAEETAQNEISKVTGGMNLPGF
ncbi:MAG: YbaB/EbfC family nucleoid-associated protein [bacterium]|nr:YbaB/EbfC family nucleoid-associated protein [bacterium]